MKKILIYSIVAAVMLLSACRKSDNPKIPELTRIVVPLITKDAAGDGTISNDDPLAFKGKFNLDVYFKNEPLPKKFDIVIVKNGDNSKQKHFKDDITTFPTSFDITGPQLVALFGEPILLGDKFSIGVDVTTQNGQLFQAFPLATDSKGKYFSPYGAGLTTQAGASVQIDYISVCPFDINDFVGEAMLADPTFWEDTYPVTISLIGTDTYKVDGYVQTPGYSFLMKVNLATQTVTIAKQIYGPTLPTTTYKNPAIEGAGVIDACKHQINLTVTNTVSIGSFGPADITISK